MVGSRTSRRAHLAGCGWFWAWAVLGAAVALAALSFGPILAAPILVIVWLMDSRPRIRRSAFGLVSGVGALLLYIAWVQRAGPGTTCWQTETASGCAQHLNPLPWLIAGIVLFVGGIAAHARRA
jgi:uncharacterized membrane protein YhaH (DUF805 family)